MLSSRLAETDAKAATNNGAASETIGSDMRIGTIYRYGRPYDSDPPEVDGLPNYFHVTYTPGAKLPLLEAGINPIQKIRSPDGLRCAAILISSSPHKIGSIETPWQDHFDSDNGHVRYFGDNKEPGTDPTTPLGNKALLEQFELHTSPEREERLKACPVVVFKRVRVGSRSKGNVEFQGFGIIRKTERITQFDRKHDRAFSNYVFDLLIMSMAVEHEEFSWDWISARRDANVSDKECLKLAPQSWKKWVANGSAAIESCRRRVVKLMTVSRDEQMPRTGTREAKALSEVYKYYAGRKSRFESIAAEIAARIIRNNGHSYRPGWITPPYSNHGADSIGRLDVGTDFGAAKVIDLGQAKCEKPTTATGGNHIARTVARLRRGWVGVYVTTSYFSEAVQREVLEDRFPVLLVNGRRVAEEVLQLAHERGFPTVKALLDDIDKGHDDQVVQRDPEEILFD